MLGSDGRPFWRRAVFCTAKDIPDERVLAASAKYRNKLGKVMELQGFRVLAVWGPEIDKRMVPPVDPDEKRFAVYALVQRAPIEHILDVPDKYVQELLKHGARLKE